MSAAGFDEVLGAIEQQLDAVAQCLAGQDPVRLEAGAQALREATARLGQVALPSPQTMGPELRRRVQAASARMAMLRENLQRLSAHTERAVTTLLPRAGGDATYGKAVGRGASGLAKAYK